jgi:hypothetical protein
MTSSEIKEMRKACANYLRAIAELAEVGSLQAFDITWTGNHDKPKGSLVVNSEFLILPSEKKEKEIEVQDLTEVLKS